MKRFIIFSLLTVATTYIFFSCSKSFLNDQPNGTLNQPVLSNQKGVEALLIGAYSLLDGYENTDGVGGWESAADNWVYGSICGGDAHKGSDGADQSAVITIEQHNPSPSNSYFNVKWKAVYEGVTRANLVIKTLALATDVSDADRIRITGEARFLRAHFHFEAKKMWNLVPYISDSATDLTVPNPNVLIPNNRDILPDIEADLQFAYQNLPATQSAVGRVNKWAAGAMLGKCLMFEKKYDQAKIVLLDVYNNGTTSLGVKYALMPHFSDNFNSATQTNSSESVFAVQSSVNDGSGAANANYGDVLNMPYGGPWDCCGFFVPSQDLVNSYKTDPTTGLPDFDNFDVNPVKNDQGLKSDAAFTPYSGTVDPRLDWTVGRRGVPYLDWGPHPGFAWMRDQSYSGPYSPVKDVYYKQQKGTLTDGNFWSSTVTANNVNLIRFSDVILWLAECEVEIGDLNQARTYVNQVRSRMKDHPDGWVNNDNNIYSAKAVVGSEAAMLAVAASSLDYVVRTDTHSTFVLLSGDPKVLSNWQEYKTPNYKIGTYDVPWADQTTARKAVHYERKLELAMEGHRFFDLVRWGEANETINKYLTYESTLRSFLSGSKFTTGKDEYYPIPQRQIDLENGVLKQNPGY